MFDFWQMEEFNRKDLVFQADCEWMGNLWAARESERMMDPYPIKLMGCEIGRNKNPNPYERIQQELQM